MIPAHDRYRHIVDVLNHTRLLRGFGISASVGAVVALALTTMLAQVTTPNDVSWVEHLTLEGALVCAVIVLWRALSAKDVQLLESARSMTAAMQTNATTQAELRKIIEAQTHLLEDSITAKSQLTDSQTHLAEVINLLRARLGDPTEHNGFTPKH